MPKAPSDTKDPRQLADWLEVTAICSEYREVSSYQLVSLLKLATTPDELEEQLLQDTFAELENRAISAGSAYPFSVRGRLLRLKLQDWRECTAYNFCLLVSFLGVNSVKKPDPTRLFETLATLVAERLLGGKAEQFGFPRRKGLPSGFAKAVEALCGGLREGGGLAPTARVYDEKDDAVDVVAWRPFPDQLPGQLVLFGQCAAGSNWKAKRSDLDPDAFCKKWFKSPPVSPLTKAFFLPHRVERARWDHLGYDAGLILDRCRIAYYAPEAANYDAHIKWMEAAVKKVNR